jgi:hypothetical protein
VFIERGGAVVETDNTRFANVYVRRRHTSYRCCMGLFQSTWVIDILLPFFPLFLLFSRKEEHQIVRFHALLNETRNPAKLTRFKEEEEEEEENDDDDDEKDKEEKEEDDEKD